MPNREMQPGETYETDLGVVTIIKPLTIATETKERIMRISIPLLSVGVSGIGHFESTAMRDLMTRWIVERRSLEGTIKDEGEEIFTAAKDFRLQLDNYIAWPNPIA